MALIIKIWIPIHNLLTKGEITSAKSAIISSMKKYEPKTSTTQNQIPEYMKKHYQNLNILDDRNLTLNLEILKSLWFEKAKKFSKKSLALVAIDILGMLVTSVASERSFSRGSLIINDQRTRISGEHACQQMIVDLNKEKAKIAMSRIDIFQ